MLKSVKHKLRVKLNFILFGLFVLLSFYTCKSVEKKYLPYNPVFDQTKKAYVKRANPNGTDLDTVLVIRPNLRDTFSYYQDTFFINDELVLDFDTLAIPVDIINEKPPIYDTFLVVTNMNFKLEFIDSLFPVIKEEKPSDSLKAVGSMARLLELQKQMEAKANQKLDSLGKPEPPRQFFAYQEIFKDSTRYFEGADSVLKYTTEQEVPYYLHDSIPFYQGIGQTVFFDSMLFLQIDTVYHEIYDPTRIVPQLSTAVMLNSYTQKQKVYDTLSYRMTVKFVVYHPEEEDVFMDMVRVVGGDFKMGSNNHDEDERPARNESVGSFLLSKYEVSNRLFNYFLNDNFCGPDGRIAGIKVIDFENPATKIYYKSNQKEFLIKDGFEDFPVVNVTWDGALMFCVAMGNKGHLPLEQITWDNIALNVMSSRLNVKGRLPLEKEWEFAAHGGIYAKRLYTDIKTKEYENEYLYAGGNYLPQLGYFRQNSMGEYHAVGRLLPNELGLHDMSGNVWEWCFDKYDFGAMEYNALAGYYVRSRSSSSSDLRVNRGGSFSNDPSFCRVTNRNFAHQFELGKNGPQKISDEALGFRMWHKW